MNLSVFVSVFVFMDVKWCCLERIDQIIDDLFIPLLALLASASYKASLLENLLFETIRDTIDTIYLFYGEKYLTNQDKKGNT